LVYFGNGVQFYSEFISGYVFIVGQEPPRLLRRRWKYNSKGCFMCQFYLLAKSNCKIDCDSSHQGMYKTAPTYLTFSSNDPHHTQSLTSHQLYTPSTLNSQQFHLRRNFY
jgi:hypothetical protein